MMRVFALSGGTPQSTAAGYVVPFRGSIVAMTLWSTAAKSAGDATFKVYREGVATTATLSWTTGAAKRHQSFQLGQHVFNAGDALDVRFTTSGFTPTTADIEVFLYLAQQVS